MDQPIMMTDDQLARFAPETLDAQIVDLACTALPDQPIAYRPTDMGRIARQIDRYERTIDLALGIVRAALEFETSWSRCYEGCCCPRCKLAEAVYELKAGLAQLGAR